MSLKQIAKYYLIMFDENFFIYKHPYYSLPSYDKKGTGIRHLEKLIKEKKPKYAIIKDNSDRSPVKYYIDSIESESFVIPTERYLKVWIILKNNQKVKYSTPAIDLEKTYWHVVNNNIKQKGLRQKVKIANVYLDENNETKLIGQFIYNKEKNMLLGRGKFHKKALFD